MPKILVVGSLAFDVIFAVHGDIKKEIPLRNGAIEQINLMFTAKEKKEYFGGTAGNIAYGLGLLKQEPLLFSLVGKDFGTEYRQHLEDLGVVLKVIEKSNEFTATFYGISDEAGQQIGIWQPNAYGKWIDQANLADKLTDNEIREVTVAIFSPGTGKSTNNMIREFRRLNKKATLIFDPSQVLSIFYDKPLLRECLELADIFIGNETEVAQLKTIFGLDIAAVLKLGVKAVIETLGDKGVNLHESSGPGKVETTFIEAIKPARVLEATGAGDAFRSGLIFGLANDKSLAESCNIGAYMGARSVGEFGGQRYNISSAEIPELLK